ncbi:ras and EF-hand domain-containing protein homolog isoform X1 [Cataglyphis hispanica]|uniref:ras and EF-hand domain-containing protein homolog isoform X1 n=1 Tax=Cataglyphis hispanica TaxID=1086592 RepID=UPI002180048D|nr:ras and EF-hand domain-containing protein homolog isoform X1 [Cataglyphis hispanica]
MAHNEGTKEGGSSTDTVIAHFSSDDEKPKPIATATSGEYVTAGDSNSSLETLTSSSGVTFFSNINTDDRKKGKFDTFKSSLREGRIFKIKKKPRETDPSCEADTEQDDKTSLKKLEIGDDKEISRQQSQQLKESKPTSVISKKKKKKKSHSLVRKLSFNKFRLSSEQQEARHTPEGGDSSRSQSQSPQESPVHPNESIEKQRQGDENVPEREKTARGELKKPEKLLEKPSKIVTVVQHTPLITKSFVQHDTVQHPQREEQDKVSRSDLQCCSTLPYALSSWPERSETKLAEDAVLRTGKTRAKSDSDSSGLRMTSESSPVEVRRKLSLLEEKRAIFQRRFFDSSKDTKDAVLTVSSLTIDDEPPSTIDNEFFEQQEEERKKRRARQISVKTFDTFSSFETALDEETGLGYLGSIEEDYTESYNSMDDHLSKSHSAMVGAVAGQSSSNNASNLGVDEKREHLYKILVIGELGAGKTSIIKRYVHQFFSQHYRATIGVDFALKVLNWDPHTIIRLQLWDIAGQERFGNMTRVYYKEAVGAFIVFDVTRSATLDAVVKWKQDLDSKVQLPDGSSIPCVLLANKCDQQKEGLVNSPTKMDEYCKEKNFSGWFETSAKENINIEEAARFLVNKILQNDQVMRGNGSQDQTDGERFALSQSPTSSKKSCSC